MRLFVNRVVYKRFVQRRSLPVHLRSKRSLLEMAHIGGSRNSRKSSTIVVSAGTSRSFVLRINPAHCVRFSGFPENSAVNATGSPSGNTVPLRLNVFSIASQIVGPLKSKERDRSQ